MEIISKRPPTPLEQARTVSFPSRQTKPAGLLHDRDLVSDRHLSVVLPGALMMEAEELREMCQYLRERLGRDDITEEFVINALQADQYKKAHERVSIKPYLKQRLAERARREGLRPTHHPVGNTKLVYAARR